MTKDIKRRKTTMEECSEVEKLKAENRLLRAEKKKQQERCPQRTYLQKGRANPLRAS